MMTDAREKYACTMMVEAALPQIPAATVGGASEQFSPLEQRTRVKIDEMKRY